MKRSCTLVSVLFLSCFGPARAADDPVLLSWRGHTITRSDFDAAMQAIPEQDRKEFRTSIRRITDLLNNMLMTRTLAAEGRALKLDKDPLIAREIAFAAERMLAGRRLQALEKSVKVPDMTAAAEERYRIKPQDFRVGDEVHASHVLVDTRSRTVEEARRRAEEVLRKAQAGADFAALAKEYSDDPSVKANGGDMGFFGRGRMVKPFEEAAFALEKADELSQPVQSPFGFHVIKLHEKKPGRQKAFAEVKDELVAQLTKKYVEDEKSRYLDALVNDKSIVINSAAVEALKIEVPKTLPPFPAENDKQNAKP